MQFNYSNINNLGHGPFLSGPVFIMVNLRVLLRSKGKTREYFLPVCIMIKLAG